MGNGPACRVMLVDDHPMVRGMLRLACEEHGLEVVGEAGNGEDAVARCLELEPDVLVLDLVLPRLHGFEVIRRIRTAGSTARVLVLTGSDEPNAVVEALRLGADGFMEKTASADDVVAAVLTVASGSKALSAEQERRARMELRELAREAERGPRNAVRIAPRARQVLELIGEGLTNLEIAQQLQISGSTVQGYVASLYRELEVTSRVQAVQRGIALGLIPRQLSAVRLHLGSPSAV